VINAYNDAMVLGVDRQQQAVLYGALAVLGAFAVAFVMQGKRLLKNRDAFITYALTGAWLFLLFKYSFV
jgi:hypothetical protein